MVQWAPALASVIGLATFVLGVFAYKGGAAYQAQLKADARLQSLIQQLRDCEAARDTLERENLNLLRALVSARNGGSQGPTPAAD